MLSCNDIRKEFLSLAILTYLIIIFFICIGKTLELCLCSQGYGDIPQNTPVQSKELRLIILYKSHGNDWWVKEAWPLGECITDYLKKLVCSNCGKGGWRTPQGRHMTSALPRNT